MVSVGIPVKSEVEIAFAGMAPVTLFRASLADKIALLKKGVPAIEAKRLNKAFALNQRVMCDALGLNTATINRKAAANQVLSVNEGERILGLVEVFGQLEAIIEESGEFDGFDAQTWFADWLRRPLPALGGAKPMEYLDTVNGQMLLAKLLLQMQTGAYA